MYLGKLNTDPGYLPRLFQSKGIGGGGEGEFIGRQFRSSLAEDSELYRLSI